MTRQQERSAAKRTRIMVDMTPELRRRIKIAAAERDVSVRDYVVGILERAVTTGTEEGYVQGLVTTETIETFLRWVVAEPYSVEASALLREWRRSDIRLTVPGLLAYEAANAIFKRVRAGNVSAAGATAALVAILGFMHKLEHDQMLHVRARFFAQQFSRPTPYDGHYVALAEREGCELWTADERLWNAVKGALSYVRWIGEYQLKAV